MDFIPERIRYYIANIFAVIFVSTVVYSGFAYPLHYGRGLWPFNRDWFMFSYDTGYDFEIEAVAKMKDGSLQILDLNREFPMRVGSTSRRSQELPRDVQVMRRFANYLCARFPANSITINEVTWLRPAGTPPPASAVPAQAKSSAAWVKDVPCGS